MPGITLMTGFGIKEDTVGVTKRTNGEFGLKQQSSMTASNAWACSGVKAGDIIEAYFFHD